MENKLKRRIVLQAGLVTGAALALKGLTVRPARSAEGQARVVTHSEPPDPTYHHNPSCCNLSLTPPWINPSCPGVPASTTSDGGNPCNCTHSS
jgi:hypothetical protein